MSKIQKQLEKMINNPLGWRIRDLKIIADRLCVSDRQSGMSHMTFRAKNGYRLTVPVQN